MNKQQHQFTNDIHTYLNICIYMRLYFRPSFQGKKEASPKDGDGCRRLDRQSPSMLTSSDYEEEDGIHINQIVNKRKDVHFRF